MSYSLFIRKNAVFVIRYVSNAQFVFFVYMSRQNITTFPFDFLFRKNSSFDDSYETEKLKDAPIDFGRIRCPLCQWQPKASSRWLCSDDDFHFGCGTSWNTFDTHGRCPGCDYQWLWTECLRCFRSSPHEAWYEYADE